MRPAAAVFACVLGCARDVADPTVDLPRGTGETAVPSGTTPPWTPTTPNTVVCVVQPDNALRVDCMALFEGPGTPAATLELPEGGARALDRVSADGALVSFTVWRLLPTTSYTVRVSMDGGTPLEAAFTTGALPDEIALANTVTGTAGFTHLLAPFQCAADPFMALLDAQGQVTWYQEVNADIPPPTLTAVDGFDVTDDGVVAVVGRSAVREWTWAGEMVLDLRLGPDLDHPVHHDVMRRDGNTFVLFAEQVAGADGNLYVTDGVYVLDPAGNELARWRMADHYAPSGWQAGPGGFWAGTFPGAWDFAHTNGIHVADDGTWLLSSLAKGTVLKLQGDWTAPDFGETVWAISGTGIGGLGDDFLLSGAIEPGDFSHQHHPGLDAAGNLTLFDNRALFGEESRATRWSLDEVGRVATLTAAWSVGEHCTVQGGAFSLASGDVVATCAPTHKAWQFPPDGPTATWTLTAACDGGTLTALTVRGQPLDFPE